MNTRSQNNEYLKYNKFDRMKRHFNEEFNVCCLLKFKKDGDLQSLVPEK
jgi:hypothetical protein